MKVSLIFLSCVRTLADRGQDYLFALETGRQRNARTIFLLFLLLIKTACSPRDQIESYVICLAAGLRNDYFFFIHDSPHAALRT